MHEAARRVRRILVAVTGASGALYADAAVRIIRSTGNEYWLVTTRAGQEVTTLELGAEALKGWEGDALEVFSEEQVDAPVASGSHPVDGMVVIPCSLHTAMAISSGLASNLVERAAQVMLKEHRPLVLMLRETPLASHHLKRLAELADAGAIIMPASPFFYDTPSSLEDMAHSLAARALRFMGIDAPVSVWNGVK